MKNGAFLYTDLEISTYVCHAPSAFEVMSIWHYKSSLLLLLLLLLLLFSPQAQSRRHDNIEGREMCNGLLLLILTVAKIYKKAELQQRWPLDAPYIWVSWKFSRIPEYAHGYFPEIFNGLLFRSILWMCLQNFKFIALPIPEIIAIEFLCVVANLSLGEEEAVWVRRWYC